MIETKIINIYGAPSSGKSTTAALVYGKMKLKKISAELVMEYAKDLIWEGLDPKTVPQKVIYNAQKSRIDRLMGKIEYIITDSPLLLSLVYGDAKRQYEFAEQLRKDAEQYKTYDFFLRPTEPYWKIGRVHTEEERDEIHRQIYAMLLSNDIDFMEMNGDADAPDKIIERVLRLQGEGAESAEKTSNGCYYCRGGLGANFSLGRWGGSEVVSRDDIHYCFHCGKPFVKGGEL